MIKKTCLAIGVAIALVSSPVVGSEIDNKTKAEFCKSIVANLNRAMASYIMRDRADKEARRKRLEADKRSELLRLLHDSHPDTKPKKERSNVDTLQDEELQFIYKIAPAYNSICG